jgi:high-affinity iron transporter
MFSNYLIALREGLEAALVVGILVAYLSKSGRRDLLPKLWTGVGVAIGVSLAFGALLTFGPRGLTFETQELIGGSLSIAAVGFVTWMILWMATAARSMKGALEGRISKAVTATTGTGGLVAVAALAVGREGLETSLFVWAAAKAAGNNAQPLVGATLGLLTAVVVGVLIHRGAVKLNMAKFFKYTGYGLIVVAAGVLAYGIHDLQEASFLPGISNLAFDVSEQIPPSSWFGTLLKGTVNFSPAATWLQILAWVLYVSIVGALFTHRLRSTKSTFSPSAPSPGMSQSS